MTAPAACPKCGTMLHLDAGVESELPPFVIHNPSRCRDVLHDKLEEEQKAHWVTANESLDAKCVRLVTQLSKANAKLEERTMERDEAMAAMKEAAAMVAEIAGPGRASPHDPGFVTMARAALERLRSHGK